MRPAKQENLLIQQTIDDRRSAADARSVCKGDVAVTDELKKPQNWTFAVARNKATMASTQCLR
jgi:hypothetical protein